MELLKIQLQDAGRVAAQLKAAGQVIYHQYKAIYSYLFSAFLSIFSRLDVFENCNCKKSFAELSLH